MKKIDVIKHFGNQAAIARAFRDAGYKISNPAISQWPEEVPELRAYQLERITNGALKAEESSKSQHATDLFSDLVA